MKRHPQSGKKIIGYVSYLPIIINHESEKKEVYLGIENRYYFQEMPDFDEIGIILKEFDGGRIRYWHDVGHAAVQENLGICRQKDLLEAYSDKIIGIHFHDVEDLHDRLSPGTGWIAYEEIIPLCKPSSLKMIEVGAGVSKEELLEGAGFMRAKFLLS